MQEAAKEKAVDVEVNVNLMSHGVTEEENV